MKFLAASFGLVASLATALAQSAGDLVIQSPASIVECQPALLSFSGGQAPYFLSVLPGGQASATPILQLPDQASAGTYTWNVNLPEGSYITLQIRDSTGLINYSSPLTVLGGTDTSCIDQAAASSVSSAGATTAASSAAASTTAAGGSASGSSSAAASSTLVSTSGSNTSAETVTAASGTPSSTVSAAAGSEGSSASSNFTCTQGLLTYGISVADLGDVTLDEAVSFFNDLEASQPTAVNVTGSGVGAQVNFAVGNLSYSFTLITNETDMTSGSLRQQFNYSGTAPLELGNGTILYDAFEDINVYTNETTNATSVQYFILGCFNDQSAGLTTLAQLIGAATSYWTENVAGNSSSSSGSSSSGAMASTTAAARKLVKLF